MKEVKFTRLFWDRGYMKFIEVDGYVFYWLGNLWVVFQSVQSLSWYIADYETGLVIDGFVEGMNYLDSSLNIIRFLISLQMLGGVK